MVRNDVLQLITRTVNGSTITDTKTQVFCAKKSVNYKEFYAAAAVGITPQFVFEVDINDFKAATKPTMVEYEETTYNILRTYEKIGEGIIEVVVS